MRSMGFAIVWLMLAYGVDATFFQGKHSEATFQIVSSISHHMLRR